MLVKKASDELKAKFEEHVAACLLKAVALFDVPTLHPDLVVIEYLTVSKATARAKRVNGVCYLQFHEQSLIDYWDETVNITIPHEVAHLVCFLRPNLGSDHNSGWKRVDGMLGGNGSVYHNQKIAHKAKVVYRYMYHVPDPINPEKLHTIAATSGLHKKLSDPRRTMYLSMNGHRTAIKPEHLKTVRRFISGKLIDEVPVDQMNLEAAKRTDDVVVDAMVDNGVVNKKAMAVQLFDIMLSRKAMINVYIERLGLTPSGAATYYQNIKSGKWS